MGIVVTRQSDKVGDRMVGRRRVFVSWMVMVGVVLGSALTALPSSAAPTWELATNSEHCAPPPHRPSSSMSAIDPFFAPARGQWKAVMLFVDFPSSHVVAGETFTTYTDRLLPDLATLNEIAYGRFSIDVTVVEQWFRLPKEAADYRLTWDAPDPDWFGYIQDAVDVTDATIDYSAYDLVYLVPPSTTKDEIQFSPAHPGAPATPDGRPYWTGVTFGADMFNWDAELLLHETGHLLGLPDLYAYEPGNDGLRFTGGWDLMGFIDSHAPDFVAWAKYVLGWIDPQDVGCVLHEGTTVGTLAPLSARSGLRMGVVPLQGKDDVRIVLEYRSGASVDSGACSTGLLATRISPHAAGGMGPVQVIDPLPGTDPGNGGARPHCGHDLDDAAITPASGLVDLGDGIAVRVRSMDASGIDFEVVRPDSIMRPTPRGRSAADVCDEHQESQRDSFADIQGNVHEYAIRCIVGAGITVGYEDGTYRPGQALSRGQAATFLAKVLDAVGGLPAWTEPGPDHFDDDEGTAHERSINRLADVDVIPRSTRQVRPRDLIDRATMAVWTFNALTHVGAVPDDDIDWYGDDDGHPDEAWINGLTSLGVASGAGGANFAPANSLTRAQMATFLSRSLSIATEVTR